MPGGRRAGGTPAPRTRRRRGLLDVSRLDEWEVSLDLLQRPFGADQVQQVLDCEAVSADAWLTAHLAGLNGDAIQAFHAANVQAGIQKLRDRNEMLCQPWAPVAATSGGPAPRRALLPRHAVIPFGDARYQPCLLGSGDIWVTNDLQVTVARPWRMP
jgi:hypothetical protein